LLPADAKSLAKIGAPRLARIRSSPNPATWGRFFQLAELQRDHSLWAQLFEVYNRDLREKVERQLSSEVERLSAGEKALKQADNDPTRWRGLLRDILYMFEDLSPNPETARRLVTERLSETKNQMARLGNYDQESFSSDILASGRNRIVALRNF